MIFFFGNIYLSNCLLDEIFIYSVRAVFHSVCLSVCMSVCLCQYVYVSVCKVVCLFCFHYRRILMLFFPAKVETIFLVCVNVRLFLYHVIIWLVNMMNQNPSYPFNISSVAILNVPSYRGLIFNIGHCLREYLKGWWLWK